MSWTEEEDKLQQATAKKDEALPVAKSVKQTDGEVLSLLESVLRENVAEKRRARRWKIFFRFASLALFVTALVYFFNDKATDMDVGHTDLVAIMPLEGVIGAGQPIDSNVFLELFNDVYQEQNLKGVVIKLNSPGGSPVHSGIIYDAIRDRKQSHPNIPVYVVVEDIAASGGYYIAAAADKIFVDKASLVGSIGVISASFDLTGLMEKVGVERRVFTAGDNKAFLDPFMPMTDEVKAKWQAVLDETHQQFISAVKSGRGERLMETKDVFSGMVFTGSQAVEIGLADEQASLHRVLSREFPGIRPVYFEVEEAPWERVVKTFGVVVAEQLSLRLNM